MYFLTALLELGGGGDLTFVKAVSLILKSHQPTGAGRSLQLGSCWHFCRTLPRSGPKADELMGCCRLCHSQIKSASFESAVTEGSCQRSVECPKLYQSCCSRIFETGSLC